MPTDKAKEQWDKKNIPSYKQNDVIDWDEALANGGVKLIPCGKEVIEHKFRPESTEESRVRNEKKRAFWGTKAHEANIERSRKEREDRDASRENPYNGDRRSRHDDRFAL